MSERIKEEYLFSWDEIPGQDSDKLVEYLRDLDVKWVKKAKIEKVDNGNTIKIYNEKKSLLFKLNSEKTMANIAIDGDEFEFMVKEENGKLNIYWEIIESDEEIEFIEDAPPKQIYIGTEEELIKFIRESPDFTHFWHETLKEKIEWEKEAWNLLNSNIGRLNPEILNKIFDLFGDWWGQLLIKPTRNKIFSTPIDNLNNWVDYLLNGKEPESVRIEKCLDEPNYKLKGAGKGLVTLFLYLKDPISCNVMMNTTMAGLEILGRFNSKKGKRQWSDYYNDYNTAAKEFRDRFDLEPQSIDWVLDRIYRLGIHRAEDGTFITYDDEETDHVHPTRDLIEQSLKELDKTKASKYELLVKMKEIVEREGNSLIDYETAWNEIMKLNDEYDE